MSAIDVVCRTTSTEIQERSFFGFFFERTVHLVLPDETDLDELSSTSLAVGHRSMLQIRHLRFEVESL